VRTGEDGSLTLTAPNGRECHADPIGQIRQLVLTERSRSRMATYVIGPEVAMQLASAGAAIRDEHRLLAPTLMRSQLLSLLYQAVQRGEMSREDAERQLDYVRGLRIRLLGDRVLQSVAWRVADQLGWSDTFAAEYIALTQLQADALVTLDVRLADAAQKLVTVAPVEALS
jgi:predicted nucleic acid-binding protein